MQTRPTRRRHRRRRRCRPSIFLITSASYFIVPANLAGSDGRLSSFHYNQFSITLDFDSKTQSCHSAGAVFFSLFFHTGPDRTVSSMRLSAASFSRRSLIVTRRRVRQRQSLSTVGQWCVITKWTEGDKKKLSLPRCHSHRRRPLVSAWWRHL